MALVLLPLPALALAAVWATATKVMGAASAGSLAVAVGLPVAAAVVGRPLGEVAAFAACGALVVARHRPNIERLRRGDEPTLATESPSDDRYGGRP
jgi:glycerol-3-phosphate acyltransferase PlsY